MRGLGMHRAIQHCPTPGQQSQPPTHRHLPEQAIAVDGQVVKRGAGLAQPEAQGLALCVVVSLRAHSSVQESPPKADSELLYRL
jgi:hypothetical protein